MTEHQVGEGMSQEVRRRGGVELPPNRYREILEIAARMICEKGYEGTSIQ
jgi:AcrR family transcriptional regulator